MSRPSIDEQIAILKRRCERMVSEEELRKRLEASQKSGKPLRIKLGMDPTAPDVTLGHCVPLKIVRQFQDWGHKAVIIVGDYTARVGDPSGRNALRPQLSGEEIDANAKTYVGQIGKILLTDPAHLEVRFNGEWLSKMNMMEVIKLLSRKTVAQLLAREDFAKRYASQTDIYLHELFYPLLQGWDSVEIEADLEMGGNDQLFNNLVGRELQEKVGKVGQMVMVTPLLVGTDGVIKMSKSKGNYIGVTDAPGGANGMFGKVMKLPDTAMEMYYTLVTDLPESEWKPLIASSPRDAKVKLAKHLISWLHDAASADQAERDFFTATSGGVPDNIPKLAIAAGNHKLAPLMVQAGFVASNSEAIRKIKENAVKLDGEKISADAFNKEVEITKDVVMQMGNKRFVKLVVG
jgi:tyrosyl-tRNA synthetase